MYSITKPQTFINAALTFMLFCLVFTTLYGSAYIAVPQPEVIQLTMVYAIAGVIFFLFAFAIWRCTFELPEKAQVTLVNIAGETATHIMVKGEMCWKLREQVYQDRLVRVLWIPNLKTVGFVTIN